MSREDVQGALEAMDDGEVRERLAAGDFSDVAGSALDEHEKELVRGAAADYPDVSGFYYTMDLNHDLFAKNFAFAAAYSYANPISPDDKPI